MADADVQITAGTGTKVDTRTVGAGTDEHRQVIVVGDPVTAAQVAGVVDETAAAAVDAMAVGGGTPHDSVDSGNPLKIGGKASTTTPSAVAAADRVDGWFGTNGQQIVSITGSNSGTSGSDGVQHSNIAHTGSVGANPLPAADYVFNGTTWDRARTIVALDAAPNVDTGVQAVGTGPGWDRKLNPSNLGTAANSAITQNVDGADMIIVHVGTSTTGTFTFEVSGDDSVWIAADALDTQADQIVTGTNLTPTTGKTFAIRTLGFREFRVRTVTTLGATMAVKTTGVIGNWWQSTGGLTAHDAPASIGKPVLMGGYASAAAPTDVSADTDAVRAWFLRNGAQATVITAAGALVGGDAANGLDVDVTRLPALVAGTANIGVVNLFVAPSGLSTFSNKYTTTQTSANLVAGTGGQRIYVSRLVLASAGTTAGRVSIYYGTGAFSAGTSITLFDGEFIPSATVAPGAVIPFPIPAGGASATGDNLRITTSAGITIYVTLDYWKA